MASIPGEQRAKWTHHNGDRYMPVFGDYWGNERDGFRREWSSLDDLHDTLAAAKSGGFVGQGSDDFNIAVVQGKQVVALLWMEDDMDEEAHVLEAVQYAIAGYLT